MADGYRVFAGARRTERMAQLAADGAIVLPLDVTEDASMVAAVRRIEADGGPVDVLINNAGYGSYGSLEEVPIDEGRRQFEVNVFGLARLTQLVLPAMRERRSGAIVNISSMGGKIYEPFGSWYHATKFAVEGMSDSLRLELEPFGIRVIVIEPGGIRSASHSSDVTIWSSRALSNARAASSTSCMRLASSRWLTAASRLRVVLDSA
jgi:short-subunit dehydrogenase